MTQQAIFPGSFDPITLGHVDIIRRGLPLFDQLVVAIGKNTSKNAHFSLDERLEMIRDIFRHEPKVEVLTFDGLTVDLCRKLGANYLLRGLRSSLDFDYERPIAEMNKLLYEEVETIFLISKAEYSPISSTVVREIIKNGGDISRFVPAEVVQRVKE